MQTATAECINCHEINPVEQGWCKKCGARQPGGNPTEIPVMYSSFKCPHCGVILRLEAQESNTRLLTCAECGKDVDLTIPLGRLAYRRQQYFSLASTLCVPLVIYTICIIPSAIAVSETFNQPWLWMWIEVTGVLWIPAAILVLLSFRYKPKERIKVMLLIIYSCVLFLFAIFIAAFLLRFLSAMAHT